MKMACASLKFLLLIKSFFIAPLSALIPFLERPRNLGRTHVAAEGADAIVNVPDHRQEREQTSGAKRIFESRRIDSHQHPTHCHHLADRGYLANGSRASDEV